MLPFRAALLAALAVLAVLSTAACERPQAGRDDSADDAQINAELGTLTVTNKVDEPVAIHLDGQELYSVPPGRSYTFRNLPVKTVTIYGVGRVSDKHYGLPDLTIEKGQEYEWTINP